jgi:hypothetical protein
MPGQNCSRWQLDTRASLRLLPHPSCQLCWSKSYPSGSHLQHYPPFWTAAIAAHRLSPVGPFAPKLKLKQSEHRALEFFAPSTSPDSILRPVARLRLPAQKHSGQAGVPLPLQATKTSGSVPALDCCCKSPVGSPMRQRRSALKPRTTQRTNAQAKLYRTSCITPLFTAV